MDSQYGYTTHTIKVGDSLQRLGSMYGLDDWREIVYLNKLEYPFIDDIIGSTEYSGNSNVAKVGDSILIPGSYSTAPSSLQIDNIASLETLAYGSDIDIYSYDSMNEFSMNLEEKGEISSDSGDIKLAEGIKNLRQQLLIRISTPLGSLILHPEFGSKLLNMVGVKGTQTNVTKFQLEVQECFLSDFRVLAVDDVIVNLKQGACNISCSITPISPYNAFKFDETLSTN